MQSKRLHLKQSYSVNVFIDFFTEVFIGMFESQCFKVSKCICFLWCTFDWSDVEYWFCVVHDNKRFPFMDCTSDRRETPVKFADADGSCLHRDDIMFNKSLTYFLRFGKKIVCDGT